MENNADWQPKSIYEQIDAISQEFNLPKESALQFLARGFPQAITPGEAKGWFALPTICAVAEQFFPDCKDPIKKYSKVTELALDKISKRSWEFENLECKSTPEKFFLAERTRLALEAISINQSGAIIILPVKFNTKINLASEDEFPLGSFYTACLGLTHFERYSQIKPEAVDTSTVECIGFGKVRCQSCWFDDARIKWRHATGYIPKFNVITS